MVKDAQENIDVLRELRTTYVDSHLTLNYGIQPCFLHYTTYMKQMTADLGYDAPDRGFTSIEALKGDIVSYVEAYRRIHEKRSFNVSFKEAEIKCLEEAVCESREVLNSLGIEAPAPADMAVVQ